MAKQGNAQKRIVERVMHEFKEGELETRGRKVRNPKQAIAIALSQAGASERQDPAEQRRALARSRRREAGMTRAELYAEAQRRDVPGRSRMSKEELLKAVRRH
jgi:hypothetical protein